MSFPTESQWARYSALCARLHSVPTSERAAALQALRAAGHEDPQVLSLVALHWVLPPDPARDRTGDRLGDFTLEEPLGAGGMGVVYRAQQHIGAATRPVAVKLIHPTLLQTAREEALTRFQAEIGTLVKLEHKGIARIYGGGIAEDPRTHELVPYLAMELVRGGVPITTYARDCTLSWPECLALFLCVCRAVQYAHDHRVIHRDLKPANILVDREGDPFVIDFGLAYACDALLPGAHLAASGTPGYMSPEQVSDALGPISAKSDVYALGLILYELLTAQHPYALPPDGTFTQWCRTITEVPPLPLHQYSEVYGRELEEIIAAALAKRPADRVRADVLHSRLERYLQKFSLDRDRPLHEPRKLPRDTQAVSHHNDRFIPPVQLQSKAEMDVRLQAAPDTPMLAERKVDYGKGELSGPGDAQGLEQAKNRAPPCIGRRQYLNWFEACFQEAHAGRLTYKFLGQQTIKNIARLVRAYRVQAASGPSDLKGRLQNRLRAWPRPRMALALVGLLLILGGGVVGWRLFLHPSWPTVGALAQRIAALALLDRPSIAVLPFVNMSNDPGQEYFSDGMTEDLITDLARLTGLFVIARNSVFTYKGKAVKPDQVGRELGVRYILEGSVRKANDRVRITAQLVDATTGYHLWAARYDRDLQDIFAVQEEIARRITRALAVRLTVEEADQMGRPYTSSHVAWEYFMRGAELYRRYTPKDNGGFCISPNKVYFRDYECMTAEEETAALR